LPVEHFEPDENGEVDKTTVTQLVRDLKPSATSAEIDAVFAKADTDNSGAINFNEFERSSNGADGQLDLRQLAEDRRRASIRDRTTGRLFLVVFILCKRVLLLQNPQRWPQLCSHWRRAW
jgi:hypothetical protein